MADPNRPSVTFAPPAAQAAVAPSTPAAPGGGNRNSSASDGVESSRDSVDATGPRFKAILTRTGEEVDFDPDDFEEWKPEVELFEVNVYRATRVAYGMLNWHCCQVRVILGTQMRESPVGQAFGTEPAFDWHTTIPNKGTHPYLVFEVLDGFGKRQGSGFVPVSEFSADKLEVQRALPLWRYGVTWEGVADAEAPLGNTGLEKGELFVHVKAVLSRDDPQAQLSESHSRRLQKARRRLKQIRVTLYNLRINLAGTKLNAATVRPYVKTGVGLQEQESLLASLLAQQEADEYVYVDPLNKAFDAGGLLIGRGEKYGGTPAGSNIHLQGYRKVEGEDEGGPFFNVNYKNHRMVFWYNLVDEIEIEVMDMVSVVGLPEGIADLTLDMNELLLKVYGAEGDLPDFVSTGRCSHELRPRTLGKDSADGPIGTLDLEIEFFQTPTAKPDEFENLFKTLGVRVSDQKNEVMASQPAIEKLKNTKFDSVLQSLTPQMKIKLADAFTAVVICNGRKGLLHEADAAQTRNRISRAVALVGKLLSLDDQQQRKMQAVVENMILSTAVDIAVQEYKDRCKELNMNPLTPVLAIVHQIFHKGQDCYYGATLRTTLEDLARRVALGKYVRGSRLFGTLEEMLFSGSKPQASTSSSASSATPVAVKVEVNDPLPNMGVIKKGLQTVRQGFASSREFRIADVKPTSAELQSNKQKSTAMAQSALPLPSVDCSANLDPFHPADVVVLSADTPPHWPIVGAVGMATLTGTAYAFAIGITAGALYKVEEKFICDLADHPHFASTCAFLHRSGVFDVTDFLASKKGATTFFALFFTITGINTWFQLTDRWRTNPELVVEPIAGPSSSPHLVICVSGFLASHGDIWTPWLLDPEYPWTDGEVCCLRFATQALLAIGDALTNTLSERAANAVAILSLLSAVSNPVSLAQQVLGFISKEMGDMLDLAILKAQEAGKQLANYLLDYQEGLNMVRPVTLCGFSTGCALIQSCLEELEQVSRSSGPRALLAADMICDVFMAGGFVHIEKNWTSLRQIISGRLINGHVPTDMVLKGYAYRRAPSGLVGGELGNVRCPGAENINLHLHVHKHVQYLRQMPLILKQYMPLKSGADTFI